MRFFFDVIDADAVTTDEEGTELPGTPQALREAGRILAEVALHRSGAGSESVELHCTVRCAGTVIATRRLCIEELTR